MISDVRFCCTLQSTTTFRLILCANSRGCIYCCCSICFHQVKKIVSAHQIAKRSKLNFLKIQIKGSKREKKSDLLIETKITSQLNTAAKQKIGKK